MKRTSFRIKNMLTKRNKETLVVKVKIQIVQVLWMVRIVQVFLAAVPFKRLVQRRILL